MGGHLSERHQLESGSIGSRHPVAAKGRAADRGRIRYEHLKDHVAGQLHDRYPAHQDPPRSDEGSDLRLRVPLPRPARWQCQQGVPEGSGSETPTRPGQASGGLIGHGQRSVIRDQQVGPPCCSSATRRDRSHPAGARPGHDLSTRAIEVPGLLGDRSPVEWGDSHVKRFHSGCMGPVPRDHNKCAMHRARGASREAARNDGGVFVADDPPPLPAVPTRGVEHRAVRRR